MLKKTSKKKLVEEITDDDLESGFKSPRVDFIAMSPDSINNTGDSKKQFIDPESIEDQLLADKNFEAAKKFQPDQNIEDFTESYQSSSDGQDIEMIGSQKVEQKQALKKIVSNENNMKLNRMVTKIMEHSQEEHSSGDIPSSEDFDRVEQESNQMKKQASNKMKIQKKDPVVEKVRLSTEVPFKKKPAQINKKLSNLQNVLDGMHDSDELSIGESSIGVGLQNRGEQSHNYGGDQSHAMSSMSSPMTGGLGGFGIGKTPTLSKHDSTKKYGNTLDFKNTLDLKRLKSSAKPGMLRKNLQAQEKEIKRKNLGNDLKQKNEKQQVKNRQKYSNYLLSQAQKSPNKNTDFEEFGDEKSLSLQSSISNDTKSDFNDSSEDDSKSSQGNIKNKSQKLGYNFKEMLEKGIQKTMATKKQPFVRRRSSIDGKVRGKLDEMGKQNSFRAKDGKKKRGTIRRFTTKNQSTSVDGETTIKQNQHQKRFEKFCQNFTKMTNLIEVPTSLLICREDGEDCENSEDEEFENERIVESINLTNDEELLLVVLKDCVEELLIIRAYKLNQADHKWQIQLGQKKGFLIKADSIAQDPGGKIYCLPYYDSGIFKLRVFDRKDKNICDLSNINSMIKISDIVKINSDSIRSLISAVFCHDEEDVLFVNLFDCMTLHNCYFKYNYRKDTMVQGSLRKFKFDSKPQNFPLEVLYEIEFDIYYVIYRHGQCITINCHNEQIKYQCSDTSEFGVQFQEIQKLNTLDDLDDLIGGPVAEGARPGGKKDLLNSTSHKKEKMLAIYNKSTTEIFSKIGVGASILFNSQIMISRNSQQIKFFKRDSVNHEEFLENNNTHLYHWKEYHTLNLEGHVHHNHGSDQIIITTLSKIFLYVLDEETFLPMLQSVMPNNMDCRMLISCPSDKAFITYNIGQPNFQIHNRKYVHKFRAEIDSFQNESGAKDNSEFCDQFCALNLARSNTFCVSGMQNIQFYDQKTFKRIDDIFGMASSSERERCLRPITSCNLKDKNSRDKPRILNMKISHKCDTHVFDTILAVFTGTSPPKQQRRVQTLHIYELLYKNASKIKLIQKIYTVSLPQILHNISTQFEFYKEEADQNILFFIDQDCVYSFNYETDAALIVVSFHAEFGFHLKQAPDNFVLNDDQTIAFVSNKQNDIMLIKLVADQNEQESSEDDMQERKTNKEKLQHSYEERVFEIGPHNFDISEIENCIFSNGKFYIVANQQGRYKGIFLINIQERPFGMVLSPKNCKDSKYFLLNQENRYDIADVDMYITSGKSRDFHLSLDSNTLTPSQKGAKLWSKIGQISNANMNIENLEDKGTKELVLSYKTIYKNTYNYIVIDIEHGNRLVFNHEIFHVWDEYIKGVLLQTNDFLTISKDALTVTSIARSSKDDKPRKIKDKERLTKIKLHSLQECAFLQLNSDNHLSFKYSKCNTKVEIRIEEQQHDAQEDQSNYVEIFTICIEEMTLWELLFLQSIYKTSSEERIANIIKEQPKTNIFFKSFLELEMSNLVTLLSFDNSSIRALLSGDQMGNFDHKYPIFYRTKPKDNEQNIQRTAIDIALDEDQYMAVDLIIEYIVKYQGQFQHSYMFQSNFTTLLSKNIKLDKLLGCDIFYHKLDYHDSYWPQTHTCKDTMRMPFNPKLNNIFIVKYAYQQVFQSQIIGQKGKLKNMSHREKVQSGQTQYKINYYMNLLPQMGVDYLTMMEQMGETENLEIFNQEAVKSLIAFKKERYSDSITQFSMTVHLVYVLCFFLLQYNTTQETIDPEKMSRALIGIMLACNTWAYGHEGWQLYKAGFTYFTDAWNLLDWCYICLGYANLIMQLYFPPQNYIDSQIEHDESQSHHHMWGTKILGILFVFIMLTKSFFYFRMWESFTKLVIMVINVVGDLREFLIFYLFIMLMLSMILAILGVGNNQFIPNEVQREYVFKLENDPSNVKSYPMDEYGGVPGIFRNFLVIMRYSLGDYSFYPIMFLGPQERYIFWMTWVVTVWITCIVFLNFIIAEVSQSYQKVVLNVAEQILKQKAQLVGESEDMLPEKVKKDDSKFPRYIIIREVEEIEMAQ